MALPLVDQFDSDTGLMGKRHDLYRQVGLRDGNVTLVANLPDRPDLRVGNSVTLKDDPAGNPDREWGIEWVSRDLIERTKLDRKWNNNI